MPDDTSETTLADFQSGSDTDAAASDSGTSSGTQAAAESDSAAEAGVDTGAPTGASSAPATADKQAQDDEGGGQPAGWLDLVSDEASWADDSCPWCLHPADEFEHDDSGVGCPNCDARIPTESKWYQNGDKIIV